MLSTSILARQRVSHWLQSSAPNYAHAVRLERQQRKLTRVREFSSTGLAVSSCPCALQFPSTLGSGPFKTSPNTRYLATTALSSTAKSIVTSNHFRHQKTATMSSTANAPVQVEHDQFRLPTNVKATHYDLTIRTDLESLVFQGLVKIK
jgi:hypothetical protein